MPSQRSKRAPKVRTAPEPRSRFAPAAFLAGTPEEVQQLCEELADHAATRLAQLSGPSWARVGRALAAQLRALGHDLISLDESDDFQDWQARWHHPRGTFTLSLTFRLPHAVEVAWTIDDVTVAARR
ncbi:MAG: hypothetical protein WDO74_33245 [Pseudomonadota bacterium]